MVQAGQSGKAIDSRSTRGPQKSLKQKRLVETLPSRKKAKTIDAQATAVVALREQSMLLPYLAQRAAAKDRFQRTPSVAKHLFSEVEAEAEWNMTVTPTDLILPRPTSSLGPTRDTPMDVAEASMAHVYNIVSEEDRTESLLRHRLANRALLGEQSPLRDAAIGSVGVDGFFYVTPFELDGF